MLLLNSIQTLLNTIMGWPLILYVISIGVICSIVLKGIQLRYFAYAWKLILFPPKQTAGVKADMTPLQAFINTLSTNLGNGSLAGVATALYAGGPGAAIWMLIIGFILMPVRFAEVYLSVLFSAEKKSSSTIGGPMLYLQSVVGGALLAPIYALLCLLFMIVGSGIQSNSIRISMQNWQINPWITATVLLLFILYVTFGGAARIVKISDRIVPIKVVVFFVSTTIILLYHASSLLPALKLMTSAAFSPLAAMGGMLGFSVQQAMRFGISRSILATESGLGTAAILFSATGSKEPEKDGIIAMLSTFISTLVCFILALCIVASGVWNNGMTSTALTIASYSTVFGWLAGWIVSFMSIAFGVGVLVAYAYITKETWISISRGKFIQPFTIIYCLCVFAGALINVDLVFTIADYTNAGMLLINLFGIFYLLPKISQGLTRFEKK